MCSVMNIVKMIYPCEKHWRSFSLDRFDNAGQGTFRGGNQARPHDGELQGADAAIGFGGWLGGAPRKGFIRA
jgi:hypothetical protein